MSRPPKRKTTTSYPWNDPRWQWLAVVLWALVLLYLSLLPSANLPRIDFWNAIVGPDKLAHALVYGVFTVLLYLPLRSQRIFGGVIAIVIAAGFGAGMEWLQYLSNTGRAFDLADILANCIGAIAGYLSIRKLTKDN